MSVPIRAKLMLLASIVGVVALLISGAINAYTQYQSGRSALLHRLQTHVDMAAFNGAAALAFDDAEAADEVLGAFRVDSAVINASIVRKDGRPLVQREFAVDTPAEIEVHADITFGERIGTVQIHATSEELRAHLRHDGLVLLGVLVGALGVALLAASLFQHVISDPIRELERAATAVSRTRDFSVRVQAAGDDEVGRLIRSFNEMLGELEALARQATEHRTELENKVAGRTAELAMALKSAQAGAQAKAEFLANMSHEIRTPMNGVVGMLELLQTEALGTDARSMLETAQHSADALMALINDVLDYSKIESGKFSLEQIDVELQPLAEDVAMLFSRQAAAKGVELSCAVHNNVPVKLRGDPLRLRQIMANLVGNAVKFTEHGEVLLGIQVREEKNAADAAGEPVTVVQILVHDTGLGMSSAVLGQLFQVFTQADSSTTRKYGGSGLGLAITKSLVDAMGGTVRVTSEPGKGSTFSVFLPLKMPAAGGADPAAATREPDRSPLRALIVDDNPTNRAILEHYLQLLSATSQSVASATAGLDAVRSATSGGSPFDVILLDYHMPDIDGIGFLRALRADPANAATPCIVLSSLGERPAAANELGVTAWLTKPVRRIQLEQVVALVRGNPAQATSLVTHKRLDLRYPGARILLVEDNQVNRAVALRMIGKIGEQVVVAVNGREAVARAKSEQFDLILMDCQMPVMDGYQATRAIREWERGNDHPGRPRLPIIAMTANALDGDREKCLAAGMDDYIAKPIKRETLIIALDRWLATASALDPAALGKLSELMGEELGEVIAIYLSDTPVQLEEIATGIRQRNLAVVARAAHSLKATSATVGALGLSEAAAAMEDAAREERWHEVAEERLAALQMAFNTARPALVKILGDSANAGRAAPAGTTSNVC
jgi:signal transduction histidine kinase/CheY-like chemotaxis protein/HPt (histidine-containing phosphotransfer) domain-containing protein